MNDFIQKIQNQSALTLLEVILASMLVGVVLLGVVSVDLAVRRTQQTTSGSAILAMQTAAAMLTISKETARAIGYQGDQGIAENDAARNRLCVRQDVPSPTPTPDIYTDDRWYCLEYDGTRNIFDCLFPADGGGNDLIALTNATPCTTANGLGILLPQNPLNPPLINNATAVNLDWNNSPGNFYIAIDLTTRNNPLTPRDPIKNPDYSVSTRVQPISHSWN